MADKKPYAKLRGRMQECNMSQEKLAEAMGISTTSLINKLAGKSDFRRKEMETIFHVLELEDVRSYFFGQ